MKVLEFAESTGQPEGVGLRVYVQGGRTSYDYGFKFDARQENDVVFLADPFETIQVVPGSRFVEKIDHAGLLM